MSTQFLLYFKDMQEFIKIEDIDFCKLCNFFWCVTTANSFWYAEETIVLGFDYFFNQVIIWNTGKFRHFIVMHPNFKGATSLKKRFFDVSTNRHDFSSSLHLGTKTAFTFFKLVKWETWNLGNYVVKGWLKHGIGWTCNWVNNLIQGQTYCNLSSQLSNWVTCRLRSKCWRTWYTRVYFDDIILETVWIKSQLNITSTFNLEGTNNAQACVTKHLVFIVWHGLGRGKYNGIPCVNPNWVKVFHVTNNQGIVSWVTHHFVLNFLETCDWTLNQTLGNRWQFQTIFSDFTQFFLVGTHTTTSTTKGKGWTNDDWVANCCCKGNWFFYCINNFRFRNRLVELFHQLFKEVTVLCLVNGR